MKFHKINILLVLGVALISLPSCIKDAAPDLGDRGPTILKLLESPEKKIFFEPFTNLKDVSLFSLRKDAPSNSELKLPTTVKVKLNPTLITDYNTAAGETFEVLPDSLFTVDPSITKSGQTYTMTLNSGDFAKDFMIKLNGAKWDLAHKYALGFTIDDASGKLISADKRDVVALSSIKNQWHGTYHSQGVFHHPVNGDRTIDEVKELVTAGARAVKAPLGDLGGSGYYMILTINNDNTVTISPAGVTPNIDQHWGPNYYDPATKSFHLFYSYNTAAPRIIEETITLQ